MKKVFFFLVLVYLIGSIGGVRAELDDYGSNINLVINNTVGANLDNNTVVNINLSTIGWAYNANGSDVRIFYGETEIDRVNTTTFSGDYVNLRFRLQKTINRGESSSDYVVTYNFPGAGDPLNNKSKIYLYANGFDDCGDGQVLTELGWTIVQGESKYFSCSNKWGYEGGQSALINKTVGTKRIALDVANYLNKINLTLEFAKLINNTNAVYRISLTNDSRSNWDEVNETTAYLYTGGTEYVKNATTGEISINTPSANTWDVIRIDFLGNRNYVNSTRALVNNKRVQANIYSPGVGGNGSKSIVLGSNPAGGDSIYGLFVDNFVIYPYFESGDVKALAEPSLIVSSNYSRGFVEDITNHQIDINVTLVNGGEKNATCNMTVGEIQNKSINVDRQIVYRIPITSENIEVNGTCITGDNLTAYVSETVYVNIKNYTLINEETGKGYVITNETIIAYVPRKNLNYTFTNTTNNFIHYISNTSDDLRIEIEYIGLDGKIIRDFNPSLHKTNTTRICVAPKQTNYEQILYSSITKAVAVYNIFADCFIAEDYTKYAYQDALMIRIFTIPKTYALYTWSTGESEELSELDGGTAQSINLELVEFAKREIGISVLSEFASINAVDNESIIIRYKNPKLESDKVTITIENETEILYEREISIEPNDVTIYFNHTAYNLSNQLLTLTVEKFKENEDIGSYVRLFYANGLSGTLNPWVAIVISVVIMFFGFTFVAVKYTFGPFGIVVDLIALAILSQAPANQYVILAQVTAVILLIFKIILFKEEFAKIN